MNWEPILRQDFLQWTNPWRHIFQLDPNQQGEFGDMKNAVEAV
jgi:hypothetical protein